jgi:hypothetical protein
VLLCCLSPSDTTSAVAGAEEMTVKIMDVKAYPLVRVFTDAGVDGVGECSPMPRLGARREPHATRPLTRAAP